MSMRAGQLRQRVTVKEPVRARDAIGGESITWREVAKAWCSIWPLAGRETPQAGQPTATVTYDVRLRKKAATDMKPDYRLEIASRVFQVVSVLNVEERGEQWRCLAVEQVR